MRFDALTHLALLTVCGVAVARGAAAAVTVAPSSGHPNLTVTIAGSSFGNSEAIDVYVDTVDTLLLVSSATGTFSEPVVIPASAQPGRHYLTAIGRKSGTASHVAFTVTTPWVVQGFGAAHLGWNPYENTLSTGNVRSLGVKWQAPVNGLGGAPAVAGGRVFVGTNAGVMALSTATGAVQWTALASSHFYGSPTLASANLFIGDTNTMYALNAATGAVIWSQATTGALYSSPVVAGGLVYAGGSEGKVYAFSKATGAIAWTFTTVGGIQSSPAVVNGILYIGSTGDKVYALNAATGALIWSYTTGGGVYYSAAVSNGVVYVGSSDKKLYAFKAAGTAAGSVLWSYATGGLINSSPAVAYGYVYVGSADGNLYALNAHSGALQWSAAALADVRSPVVANGVAYVTTGANSILAFDAFYGQTLATGSVGTALLGNPVVSDGVVYLNTFDDDTYAFALLAGTNAVRAPAPASLHPDLRLVARR